MERRNINRFRNIRHTKFHAGKETTTKKKTNFRHVNRIRDSMKKTPRLPFHLESLLSFKNVKDKDPTMLVFLSVHCGSRKALAENEQNSAKITMTKNQQPSKEKNLTYHTRK